MTALPTEYTAVFQPEDQYHELRRYPQKDTMGISLVWGSKETDQSLGLVQILADSAYWDLAGFKRWLKDNGYKPKELMEPIDMPRQNKSAEHTRNTNTTKVDTEKIPLSQSIITALERKVEEHNEEHGGAKTKRATQSMLERSFRRGIGAYKTNPGSVRPNVKSPEQWAYARVNGLLYALRNGRFRRQPYDRDLLPKGHPMSSKTNKSDDLYNTMDEALERAREIGCVGYHTHEVDGQTMYMPCGEMSDYTRLTGLQHTSDTDTTLVGKEDNLYATPNEAKAEAMRIGCVGYHVHEVDGTTRYMACETMGEYERVSGQRKARQETNKAEWSTAYVNDLADSAFLYIGPDGEKDDDGKTVPRTLRKLPYKNHTGQVDLAHLRNALARLSQTDIPKDEQNQIRERAQRILAEENERQQTTKQYEDLDFVPPRGAQEAAELGLALRREHGRGGTLIGVARARDLAQGRRLSPDTIRRMVSFFARHEIDLDAPANRDRGHEGYPGAGRIAWLLWGGDPGRRCAERTLERMKREDDKRDELAKSAVANERVMVTKMETMQNAKDMWKLDYPVHVTQCPNGERFLLRKTVNGNEILPQSDDVALYQTLQALPDNTVVEVVKDKHGTVWVLDTPMVGGVDVAVLPAKERMQAIRKHSDGKAFVVDGGRTVQTAEELILSTRSDYDAGVPVLDIRPARTAYSAYPSLQLDLVKHQQTLWNYVPPRLPVNPQVLFVATSPSRLEAVRGQPLVGPNGLTFKELYLDRIGLDINEVGVVYTSPQLKDQGAQWDEWLQNVLDQYDGVPLVALGKVASKSLSKRKHLVMPHPHAVRRKGDRGEVARKTKMIKKSLGKRPNRYCPILKADDEKQIVYGVVLEPNTRDLQGDVLSVDTIEQAAHKYMAVSRTVGDSHSSEANAVVVESYLAPADYKLGGHSISKGTWIMGVHVLDDQMWKAVKRGEFTGFSIGGRGKRSQI